MATLASMRHVQNPSILVSGSGIAGSVFAYWILRACPGADVTIVERDPALRLTGASVDIRSSGVDIIKLMGTEPLIKAQTTNEAGMQFLSPSGKVAGTVKASGRSDIQTITSEYEIFRGVLAKIFTDVVQSKVKLMFSESVESYEQRDDKVIVTFKNSKIVKSFDLLVAADGTGSKIRTMMLKSAEPVERLWREGAHVAYFTMKKDLLHGENYAKWYNATGGRSILLRPDEEGRTRAMFMIVTPSSDVERKAKLRKAMKDGNESYMTCLEETFADVGWLTKEVLQGMRESEDFHCSIFGQMKCPKLQDGRVVVIGDAAYATPGFGTSLAIIGGYVLAGELFRSEWDVEKGVKAYEDLMLPFVKSQQGGDKVDQLISPQSSWGIGIRNAIIKIITTLKVPEMMIMGMAALGIKEGKVDMPDYKWPPADESG